MSVLHTEVNIELSFVYNTQNCELRRNHFRPAIVGHCSFARQQDNAAAVHAKLQSRTEQSLAAPGSPTLRLPTRSARQRTTSFSDLHHTLPSLTLILSSATLHSALLLAGWMQSTWQ